MAKIKLVNLLSESTYLNEFRQKLIPSKSYSPHNKEFMSRDNAKIFFKLLAYYRHSAKGAKKSTLRQKNIPLQQAIRETEKIYQALIRISLLIHKSSKELLNAPTPLSHHLFQ